MLGGAGRNDRDLSADRQDSDAKIASLLNYNRPRIALTIRQDVALKIATPKFPQCTPSWILQTSALAEQPAAGRERAGPFGPAIRGVSQESA